MSDVRIVPAEAVRPLRAKVLRPTAPHDVVWPGDDGADTVHVAAFDGGAVVGIATLFPKGHPNGAAPGDWQLRGMAVETSLQKKGVGAAVLDGALAAIRARGAVRLWCNARTSAEGFYLRHGFTTVSGVFEVPGVGPHVVMQRAV